MTATADWIRIATDVDYFYTEGNREKSCAPNLFKYLYFRAMVRGLHNGGVPSSWRWYGSTKATSMRLGHWGRAVKAGAACAVLALALILGHSARADLITNGNFASPGVNGGWNIYSS